MDPASLRSSLQQVAADLTLAGEPVPFDLVVERHLPLFLQIRAAGLRTSSIARLFAQAGARRPDGTAFTADQLRASLSRARRRQAAATDLSQVDPPRPTPAHARASPPPPRPPSNWKEPAAKAPAVAPATVGEIASGGDVDLSDIELRLARERLLRP